MKSLARLALAMRDWWVVFSHQKHGHMHTRLTTSDQRLMTSIIILLSPRFPSYYLRTRFDK